MIESTWSDNALQRFWSKVDKSGDCWLWEGSVSGHGYGTFYAGPNKYMPAHRFSYIAKHGSSGLSRSIHIDHVCRNRRCVNPDHLRKATHKQNIENHGGPRKNSKSKVRGVYWQKQRKRWQAQVTHEGRTVSRVFHDLQQAEAWVIATRNSFHTYNDQDRLTG